MCESKQAWSGLGCCCGHCMARTLILLWLLFLSTGVKIKSYRNDTYFSMGYGLFYKLNTYIITIMERCGSIRTCNTFKLLFSMTCFIPTNFMFIIETLGN